MTPPLCIVTGSDLAVATGFLGGLAPARPTAPELGGVVLHASDVEQTVTLSVFDGDIAGSATLSAAVDVRMTALVSTRLLGLIAATLIREPGVSVAVEPDQRAATIQAGRSSWQLPTMDLRYYPTLPDLGASIGQVNADEFATALARVLPAAGTRGDGIMFGGVCLTGTRELLTIATTDQWRLGIAEVDWSAQGSLPDTLVPADLLNLAATAARREATQNVALHIGSRFAMVGEVFTVSAPLLASHNAGIWRRVEHRMGEPVTRVVVDTTTLKQTTARAAAVLDPADSLSLQAEPGEAGPGEICIEAQVGTRSVTVHRCPSLAHDGPAKCLGVNGHYLAQAITALGSPTTILEFAARDTRPCRLLPGDEDGTVLPGYRHLIAPRYAKSVPQVA